MHPLRFQSILWLDDLRQPLLLGVDWVKSYDEFVAYLETHPVPELICFDHDLAIEHYPVNEDNPSARIPYGSYEEKTGLDAARYVIEKAIPIKYWNVHSFNARGKHNIETELRRYYPEGELRHLNVPYRIASQ